MKRNMICIVCPMGCMLEVTQDEAGKVCEVQGNRCPRGKTYAVAECTSPMRMLTSTIRVENGLYGRLPVISSQSIPKERIFDVMAEINRVCRKAPVALREVMIADVCGLGVDIIASRSMPAKEEIAENTR